MIEILNEHRHYLSDVNRLAAFRSALKEVVKPNSVVLDLGAGTGILGLLALEAGAQRVYAVDAGPIIELAQSAALLNHLGRRITYIKGLSSEIDLPEPVDVVVADQLDPLGVRAGVLEYFADARRRFLKRSGTTIPGRLDLCVGLIECSPARELVDFWRGSATGYRFPPFYEVAANTIHEYNFVDEHLVSAPAVGVSVDLSITQPAPLRLQTILTASRDGLLHGIAAWFRARLSPSVEITNAPGTAGRINRAQAFLPLQESVRVRSGDSVHVTLHMLPVEQAVTWTVKVVANGEEAQLASDSNSFVQSTLKGLMLTPQELQKTRPDFIPNLSRRGMARRTVLQLCDGATSLTAIEQELYRTYQDVFHSPEEAAAFVGDLVRRNTL